MKYMGTKNQTRLRSALKLTSGISLKSTVTAIQLSCNKITQVRGCFRMGQGKRP